MEITGKIIQLMPLQSGEGKNGTWRKQEFVIETEAQYPKKVCISAWGDKINTGILAEGNKVKVSFDVESREYNGRWYTDVKAWKIEGNSNAAPAATQPANDYQDMPTYDVNDDLPF